MKSTEYDNKSKNDPVLEERSSSSKEAGLLLALPPELRKLVTARAIAPEPPAAAPVVRRSDSGVVSSMDSGRVSRPADASISESKLVREPVTEEWEDMLPIGVAATIDEKYFSCSMLVDVS